MAFIDELGKKFTEVVKKVGEKSEELMGVGKLNYEIYKEQDIVKRLYKDIGEAVYEAYSKEDNSLNAVYKLCQEIDKHRQKIEHLSQQIESLKAETQAKAQPQERTDNNPYVKETAEEEEPVQQEFEQQENIQE
jgi:prefoldin subunit 5